MSVPNARVVEGRKYYWDGQRYASSGDAAAAQAAYERDGFDTSVAESDGTYLVYSRRVVRQVGNATAN